MPFRLDWRLHEDKPEAEKRQFLEAQARHARDILVEELDFVLSHPEITSSLLRVGMFGLRYADAYDRLDFAVNSQEYLDFFGPIHTRVNDLLHKAKNIGSLFLGHFPIPEDVASAAMSLHSLRAIVVSCCELLGDGSLPQCPTILNASLIVGPTHISSWKFLKSLVDLRFLRIRCSSGERGMGPGIEFRGECNPFRALERLVLERMEWEDRDEITLWLQAAPALRLTHFKVEAGDSGIDEGESAQLLLALSASPLQVLILDGLQYVGLDVFERIANFFPNITSLSLIYRESSRQVRTRCTMWPLPSWKYAPVLQLFHHLEFFGWNFGMDEMEWSFSPTLQLFEEGFPEDWWELPQMKSLADWGSIARVLAAYCPTLRYVIFLPFSQYCAVSRSPSGRIIVSSEQAHTYDYGDSYPLEASQWEV